MQYMVKRMRIGYKEKKILDKVYVFESSFKKVSGYETNFVWYPDRNSCKYKSFDFNNSKKFSIVEA